MSATIDRGTAEQRVSNVSDTATAPSWPRLLEGTELIGQVAGSGLREPPYLVRRCDGQVVQLSRLLYAIASSMDGRSLSEIAERVQAELQVGITAEQVAYVAEARLAPLGIIRFRDGTTAPLKRLDPMLALRFRVGIVPERWVNALARLLRGLFLPPLIMAALVSLVACDVWLGAEHGIGSGLRTVIHHPALGLAIFGSVVLSLAFHECGHAAACRYGGARPGRIGVGLYLVWPVFYTDVTDSYRLSKAGRLRTDLGGVYFNVLFALGAAGAYLLTSYEPLLIIVVSQQMLLLDQFVPWVRLDGYHIVSDLIGVSDLFARIKPVMASLRPGRPADRRVTELKRWARAAVTVWVLATVTALGTLFLTIIVYAPGFLSRAWQSLILQFDELTHGLRLANLVDVLTGTVGLVMLLLPAAGITLSYVLICRRIGTALAVRGARSDLTLAAPGGEKNPHSSPAGLPEPSSVQSPHSAVSPGTRS